MDKIKKILKKNRCIIAFFIAVIAVIPYIIGLFILEPIGYFIIALGRLFEFDFNKFKFELNEIYRIYKFRK